MPKRVILSLDGGGIRGAYQSYILDKLRASKIKFDLIVGVSAGALNGILYSQQKAKCLEVFSQENSEKICSKSLFDKVFNKVQPCPIYDIAGKKEVIVNYTTALKLGQLPTPMAVIAYDVNGRYPRVFKSWVDTDDSTIDVALATSAAPVYYPAHKYKGRWYVDGGIAMNNPSLLAYSLGKELYPGDELFLLSIGTGDCPDVDLGNKDLSKWGSIQWIIGGLFQLFVNSPSQYSDEVCQTLIGEKYLRLEDDTIGELETDDSSKQSYDRIISAAERTWSISGEKILAFIAA
jgi:patatin-like phospholipase/acyl hydrolase